MDEHRPSRPQASRCARASMRPLGPDATRYTDRIRSKGVKVALQTDTASSRASASTAPRTERSARPMGVVVVSNAGWTLGRSAGVPAPHHRYALGHDPYIKREEGIMKISIQIDASPEEVRQCFGWPPMQPFHEELMRIVQENMKKGVTGFDPMTLMQAFIPTRFPGAEMIQKAFFDALKPGAAKGTSEAPDPVQR